MMRVCRGGLRGKDERECRGYLREPRSGMGVSKLRNPINMELQVYWIYQFPVAPSVDPYLNFFFNSVHSFLNK